jgi:hypothetical protein
MGGSRRVVEMHCLDHNFVGGPTPLSRHMRPTWRCDACPTVGDRRPNDAHIVGDGSKRGLSVRWESRPSHALVWTLGRQGFRLLSRQRRPTLIASPVCQGPCCGEESAVLKRPNPRHRSRSGSKETSLNEPVRSFSRHSHQDSRPLTGSNLTSTRVPCLMFGFALKPAAIQARVWDFLRI